MTPHATASQRYGDQRALRRTALGGVLSAHRTRQGLALVDAARDARLSHMAIRRAEDGVNVRPKTYAALEAWLNLQAGSIQRAVDDDRALVDVARTLGLDVTGADQDPAGWVARFVETVMSQSRRHVTIPAGPSTANSAASVTAVAGATVGDLVDALISRLSRQRRTEAADDVLLALVALAPELADQGQLTLDASLAALDARAEARSVSVADYMAGQCATA